MQIHRENQSGGGDKRCSRREKLRKLDVGGIHMEMEEKEMEMRLEKER